MYELNINIGELIEKRIEKKGLIRSWVAKQLGVNDSSLHYKLKKGSFSGTELVILGMILDIDLNELKSSVKETS